MPSPHAAYAAAMFLLTFRDLFHSIFFIRGAIATVGLFFFGWQAGRVMPKSQRHVLVLWALGIFVFFPLYIGLFIYLMQPFIPHISDGLFGTLFVIVILIYVGFMTRALIRAGERARVAMGLPKR